MRDCRVGNIGEVGGEAQNLGHLEYIGWGGVLGDIRSVEEEKPHWEPIGGKMVILGDINEVDQGLEPTWRTKRWPRGTKSSW